MTKTLMSAASSGLDCSVVTEGVLATVQHHGEWITLRLNGVRSYSGRKAGFLRMLTEWDCGKRGIVAFSTRHLLCHV